MENISREKFQSFMDTTPTGATRTYCLLGEGFSEITEALNPTQKDTHYVHQTSGTSSITGYAPTFDFTAENGTGDDALEFIAKIGRERLVGAAAETTIVNVNLFEEVKETTGSYVAYQQKVAIKVDQVNGGAGGEDMPLTGSFLYKGDAVKGKYVLSTNTFTAD